MNIGLISAAYPPDFDGIGDYTWWMARTLGEGHEVRVFTRLGREHQPSPGVKVCGFFDPMAPSSFASLTSHVESWTRQGTGTRWLVLQYNPFSYGRRGYCPWVPRTLELIKERCPNTRIAVMFHETFTGEQGPGPQIMRLWQKKQVKKLCAIADKILVSTTAWLPQLGSEASQRAISLPVGSNVSECRIDRGAARLAYSIPEDHFVLGVFGNAHVSRQFEWIGYAAARLLEAGMRVGVLYIGADGERVSGYFDGVKFVDAGPLPSGDAGKALRAADLFASPFTDGFTTRRGSVMAALQHSVAVIATDGFRTEQWLRDYKPAPMYLVSPNNREAFATATVQLAKEPERRRQFERNGIAFYREECDWPVIAKRLESSFSGCESN